VIGSADLASFIVNATAGLPRHRAHVRGGTWAPFGNPQSRWSGGGGGTVRRPFPSARPLQIVFGLGPGSKKKFRIFFEKQTARLLVS